MKKLTFHPLFLAGLALRLALIVLAMPGPVTTWYAPFLDASTQAWTFDPWQAWMQAGGSPAAFPYGYVMWLVFVPLTLVCKALGLPILYGHGATLLLADVALLGVLRRLISDKERLLLGAYWLSPIVLLATYAMGFNDLVPVLLLMIALQLMRQARFTWAGVACTAAISAKLSMVLALPFIAIYLWQNRSMRPFVRPFAQGLAIGLLVLGVPFALSPAALGMLLNNPELGKVYRLAIPLGQTVIYVLPLAYMVMLYTTWRVRRLNFELFHAMLGMAFLGVVLMTPASPGWFIWALPLLVSYQAGSDRVAMALTALFSTLYVLTTLLASPLALAVPGLPGGLTWDAAAGLGGHAVSLVQTAMVATGIVLCMRVWRETVARNDFFRLSRKPFVIGIAGDSGAGKDTFSDALEGLFGSHSVTTLSGDDYHLWDRQKPMWQVMTHLNPMANDLEGYARDLLALTDGRAIQSRHYDHQTGRMSRPFTIPSNDIILASGLHALYLPILRECYNLSIYLDIDEKLRRHFKLQRDVHQRGHTVERVLASFDKREPDSARFIRPQAEHADLILSVQPIHPRILDDLHKHPLRFKVVARSRHGLSEMSLTRVLTGVCGLHVDMTVCEEGNAVELTMEGETSAEDIALAAQMVCPRVLEFLDIQPQWEDGVLGLMQLITLSHIHQALTKRFI